MKRLSELLLFIFCLSAVFSIKLFGQSIDFSNEPTVIYYGCDHFSLTADSISPEADSALNITSYYIYRDIMQDSLTKYILFVAPESADTTSADTARDVFTAPVDSMTQPSLGSGYWMGSTITGSKGNYTLTVYIKDASAKTVFAKGIATFSSIASADIKNACAAAVAQILPIITKIQNYQIKLRSENPSLSIDPQITITLAGSNLNYGESINVTVNATDYDGTPIANMKVYLSAQGMDDDGTLSADSVITGADGRATAVFTAGSHDGFVVITAWSAGVPLVTYNTTRISDADNIIIGKGNQDVIWQGNFKYKVTIATQEEGASYSKTGWSTHRNVYTETDNAKGKYLFGIGETADKGYTWDYNPLRIDLSYNVYSGGTFSGNGQSHEEDNSMGFSIGTKACGASFSRGSVEMNSGGNFDPDVPSEPTNPEAQAVDTATGFPFGTFCIFIPFYDVNSKYKYREYDVTVSGCGINKYADTSSDNSYLGGYLEAFITTGTAGGSFSADSNLVKFSYSHTADTSKSQYQVTVDPAGLHVTYESASYDTNIQFTAVFKPYSVTPTRIEKQASSFPKTFALLQNYPNPFNPVTTIKYQIPKISRVNLTVFDILGNRIAVLVNQEKSPGEYSVEFNGSNLASGVYFYRIQAGNYLSTKKLILLK